MSMIMIVERGWGFVVGFQLLVDGAYGYILFASGTKRSQRGQNEWY